MSTAPSLQLDEHPGLQRERHKSDKLHTELKASEAARAGLLAERTALEEERRAAMVERHLSGNSEDDHFPPDKLIRLRAIDGDLVTLDIAIEALHEAAVRQGDIERQVRLDARVDQRERALERARVLVTGMFDLMVEFQKQQNELCGLYDKGPLGPTRGLPHISLPILIANFREWSRVALDFIAPRSRSRPKTATSRAADRHVSP